MSYPAPSAESFEREKWQADVRLRERGFVVHVDGLTVDRPWPSRIETDDPDADGILERDRTAPQRPPDPERSSAGLAASGVRIELVYLMK